MKKTFIVTWEGKYTPPSTEDVFRILQEGNFDELATVEVKEVEE